MPVVAKGKRSIEAARRVDRLATEGMLDERYERNMYGMHEKGKIKDSDPGPVIPMRKVADARSLAYAVNRAEYLQRQAREAGEAIRDAKAGRPRGTPGSGDYTTNLALKKSPTGRLLMR